MYVYIYIYIHTYACPTLSARKEVQIYECIDLDTWIYCYSDIDRYMYVCMYVCIGRRTAHQAPCPTLSARKEVQIYIDIDILIY